MSEVKHGTTRLIYMEVNDGKSFNAKGKLKDDDKIKNCYIGRVAGKSVDVVRMGYINVSSEDEPKEGETFASGSDVLEYKRVENLRIKEGKPLMREDGSPQVVYTLEHKDNLRDTAGARDRAIAKLASYDLVEVKTEVLEPSEA